jgi:hypothetical protein
MGNHFCVVHPLSSGEMAMRNAAGMNPACRWIRSEQQAFLHWNYVCIASVKPDGKRYAVEISWCQYTHRGRAATLAQGMRFIERWVTCQKGLPGLGRHGGKRGR